MIYSGKRKRAVAAAFEGRPRLSGIEFWKKYFEEKGIPSEVALGVREVLEHVLDSDLSRLAADDDFKQNLEFFFALDSMADVEIVVELEKKFGVSIEDREAAETSTIDDIVELVWRKLHAPHV